LEQFLTRDEQILSIIRKLHLLACEVIENPNDPSLHFEIICHGDDMVQEAEYLLKPWYRKAWERIKYYRPWRRLEDEIPF
ncbi:MAG TPA: hypothetical protein VHQ01_03120, partial [Pyrinomonadaceae bacterium]|nr:hypothetical protein [Pyrinomonadaceae bacterium]